MAISVKVQSSRTIRAAVHRALGELFPGARLRQESSPAEGAWAIALTLPRPGKTHRLLLAFKSLFTLAAYYQGGPAAVAAALWPFRDEPPVRRALAAIAEKFRA